MPPANALKRGCELAAAVLCLLPGVAPASAGTLSGVVRNGTTGQVAAGVDVILIQLQGGMEPVATAKTDSQGRYSLAHPQAGQAPMLLRVVHKGVNYHQNVPPGRESADVQIFEDSARPADISVRRRVLLLQPDGASLVVGEEFSMENHSRPQATFFRPGGTFEFSIPQGATLNDVSAAGPAGMAVVQGTINKGPNRYAIAFPLRPGENLIRLAYQLPYAGNRAQFAVASPFAVDQVMVWAPATMTVEGGGLARAASEQGGTIYSRQSVTAGATMTLDVSGTANPLSSGGGAAAEQSGGAPERPANIREAPGRLAALQPVLIAGFAVLFALGLIYLWRQPGTAGSDGRPVIAAVAELKHGASPASRPAPGSLDELRDTLLRIEIRRLAGTMSEADYAEQRRRIENTLRELLKD